MPVRRNAPVADRLMSIHDSATRIAHLLGDACPPDVLGELANIRLHASSITIDLTDGRPDAQRTGGRTHDPEI